tara:strand:+ start:3516 stop:4127 length:612 start_codon:yes stop_codon:yes gene_type:complete
MKPKPSPRKKSREILQLEKQIKNLEKSAKLLENKIENATEVMFENPNNQQSYNVVNKLMREREDILNKLNASRQSYNIAYGEFKKLYRRGETFLPCNRIKNAAAAEKKCNPDRPSPKQVKGFKPRSASSPLGVKKESSKPVPQKRARRGSLTNAFQKLTMHSGGLIRSTGEYRLLSGEIILSREQKKGLTHGQIVKLIEKYHK